MLNQIEVLDLLITGFTGTLLQWWERHLSQTQKDAIRHSIKKDPEGLPLFNEAVGMAYSDTINTLVFTIIEHFIGTPSELRSRIHDQLSNLRCPTMSDFRWYKDVFISKVMVREDSSAPFWKEKFINGLPSLFAHKINVGVI